MHTACKTQRSKTTPIAKEPTLFVLNVGFLPAADPTTLIPFAENNGHNIRHHSPLPTKRVCFSELKPNMADAELKIQVSSAVESMRWMLRIRVEATVDNALPVSL